MIHDRRIALICRIGFFIFAIVGVLPYLNLFSDKLDFSQYMYYTIQSNLLAVILFGILSVTTAIGLKKDGAIGSAGYFPRFEMVCTIDLLVTLIIYWVLLAPTVFSMGDNFSLWTFDNVAVHLVTPILCLVDYILFTDSKHLKYVDVFSVLIYPIFYLIFSSIAGLMGYVYRVSTIDGTPVRFPYFFYDFDRESTGTIIVSIIILIVFFLILSHLFYLFDKKIKKPILIPKNKK